MDPTLAAVALGKLLKKPKFADGVGLFIQDRKKRARVSSEEDQSTVFHSAPTGASHEKSLLVVKTFKS